jgi:hypothetical protein
MVARAASIALWMTVVGLAASAQAAEWGGIAPATTTMEQVRKRYGGPTRTVMQKSEGYDTAQWVYDGAQAPAGTTRMTVDFGLLSGQTYRPDVVRSFKIEPRRGVFTRRMITTGWGEPNHVSPRGQMPPSFFYDSGLFVTFDKDGRIAETMLFTPPQILPPAAKPPPR